MEFWLTPEQPPLHPHPLPLQGEQKGLRAQIIQHLPCPLRWSVH